MTRATLPWGRLALAAALVPCCILAAPAPKAAAPAKFVAVPQQGAPSTPATGSAAAAATAVDLNQWWRSFNDAELDALIERAIRANPDIEIALTPFGQVDNRLARRYEGTGLGLPLAKELIELHHGALVIKSEPGHGSTFTMLLPAAVRP